jgi:uncharacterized protein YjaZ
MAVQHGSVLTGEQIVFEGQIDVQESTGRNGVASWTAEFVVQKITMELDGEMTLNLSDGRSGQMFVKRNDLSGDGMTTVICGGTKPLT